MQWFDQLECNQMARIISVYIVAPPSPPLWVQA